MFKKRKIKNVVSNVYENTKINEIKITSEYQIPFSERFGKIDEDYIKILKKYRLPIDDYLERQKQCKKYIIEMFREEKKRRNEKNN